MKGIINMLLLMVAKHKCIHTLIRQEADKYTPSMHPSPHIIH